MGNLSNPAEAPREAPKNIEVEQALLGALLRRNELADLAADTGLEAHHFFAPEHQRIFSLIGEMIEASRVATPETLARAMQTDELLSDLGIEYLLNLQASIITLTNIEDYSRTVTDTYQRRELIGAMRDATDQLYEFNPDKSAREIGEQITDSIMGVSPDAPDKSQVTTLGAAVSSLVDIYDEAAKDPDAHMGLTTGLSDLDGMISGFTAGKVYVLAGRPAMGKTALSFSLLQRLATNAGNSAHTLFFSLEMGEDELAERAIVAKTRINSRKARHGKIDNPKDWDAIEEAAQYFHDVRVLIDDRAGHTVASIERCLRQQMRKKKISAVVIDYLQIITPPRHLAGRSRNDEVAYMTREIKRIAKRWHVPIILLSQLSREVEKREDKRPNLSDLRDSGSIEQDADLVGFLYRAEYYLAKETPERRGSETAEQFEERNARHTQRLAESRNVMEIIIAKQRSGPEGTLELFCDLSTMNFASMSRQEYPESGSRAAGDTGDLF